jgi:hypothetical protein
MKCRYVISILIIADYYAHLLKLASDGIKKDFSQAYLDKANYTFEIKDGRDNVEKVKRELGEYFNKKKKAAEVGLSKVWMCEIKGA